MFAIERYNKAQNVKEAVNLLAADPDAKIIAGGTDVLIRLHGGSKEYRNLVDINGLAELKEISEEAGGAVRIGSMATFSEIMDSDIVNRCVPVIAEAVSTVGGPQLRNTATMGGNICNGAVSADSAGALLVLQADLEIQGIGGEREVPVVGFHQGPGRVSLKQGDVLTAFRIKPENYKGFGASYYKYAMRDAMDIATIGCAAAARLDGDKIDELRLAFTVAAPKPIRCEHAEKTAAGKPLSEKTLEAISDIVQKDVKPRSSWRAAQEFRLHLIRTLTQRVVRQAIERAGGKF
ncbi:xanthine dehydrogenase FAD-binding subunit XdhB [Desulfococcaceae bacterium HSG9]|nr:xanthine dehydrogenase FAD-binding subunit XdhB [Desulfococcaceae bacterium HSG9]